MTPCSNLIVGLLPALAAAQQSEVPAPPPVPAPAPAPVAVSEPRPTWSLLRQEEDWSSIEAVPLDERSPAERLKWRALDADGDLRLTVGGSLRARVESFRAFGQTAGQDAAYSLAHAHLFADLQHRSGLRAFVELESAFVWDRELPGGTRPVDENQFDLYQGFVEQGLDLGEDRRFALRAGRQTLFYGKLRLVSPLPWANVYNRFQGALGRLEFGPWTVDGFLTEAVEIDVDQADEASDDALFGVYATRADGGRTLDLYLLGVDREGRAFNGTSGDERRYTLGARVNRAPRPGALDYDLELAQQFGEVGDGDVIATMVGAQLGYRFEGDAAPRAKAIFELGTGDGAPGGNVQTFDTPYPLGHAYFGIADALGRQNAIDLGLGVEWPLGAWTLDATLHQFWRESDADAIYRVNGAAYAGSAGVGGSDLGQEFDLVVSRRFGRHVALELGYAHLFVGPAFEANGLGDDLDFAYLQTSLVF